jgi:hypothetical protein
METKVFNLSPFEGIFPGGLYVCGPFFYRCHRIFYIFCKTAYQYIKIQEKLQRLISYRQT